MYLYCVKLGSEYTRETEEMYQGQVLLTELLNSEH